MTDINAAEKRACFLLLNQTFALADFLSLEIFFAIEISQKRRCWSSNGSSFQRDFIDNNLLFRDDDLWLQPGSLKGGRVMKEEELFCFLTSGLTCVLDNDESLKSEASGISSALVKWEPPFKTDFNIETLPSMSFTNVLLNQTFALADLVSKKIFVGISMPSNRRCWASNCRDFMRDFIKRNIRFRENDLWLRPGRRQGGRAIQENELFKVENCGLGDVGLFSSDNLETPMVVDEVGEQKAQEEI